MKWLIDASVFFSAVYTEHAHHKIARAWLDRAKSDGWGVAVETCLTVMRLQMLPAAMNQLPCKVGTALATLEREFTGTHPVRVLPGERPAAAFLGRVQGSRQINDFYLVQLAAAHGAKLATFDRGIVAEWPEYSVLVN